MIADTATEDRDRVDTATEVECQLQQAPSNANNRALGESAARCLGLNRCARMIVSEKNNSRQGIIRIWRGLKADTTAVSTSMAENS